MRSLFLSAVFGYLLLLGFSAPFVAALAYVWVDIVKPQNLAYSMIQGMPLSFIAGAATVVLYFLFDRKNAPRFTWILFLLLFFASWITLTTATAVPDLRPYSWNKWDWVFKVLIFTVLIPYIFRSRFQIEALILVILFSAATVFFSAGVKTALGSGGYGSLAILGGGDNSGLAEGSTLATVCVMLIPIMHYALRNSAIFSRNWYTNLLFLSLIATAVLTVIGTNARTGVIAFLALFFCYFLRSKKKIAWIALVITGLAVFNLLDISTSSWSDRMSTINTYDRDSSAMGRIAVWKWTIEYVGDHPLGGGFDAYRLNRISFADENGISFYEPGVLSGKAFHSIYFEVLGEQGLLGFAVYLVIFLTTLFRLRNIQKTQSTDPELAWTANLARGLADSLTAFLAGGCFVGIAYQPYAFYIVALCIALEQYLSRSQQYYASQKLNDDQRTKNIRSFG